MVGSMTIFDARPKMNAQGNRVRGGGFEDERYYPNCNLVFCGIENIHAVKSSFNSMFNLCESPELFSNIVMYGPEVEETGYM